MRASADHMLFQSRHMNVPKFLGWSLLLMALAVMPAQAQSKVGTTAAGFLQIGAGARGVAMGETAVASARDLSAVYWNPALAADLDGHHVYFNHTDWFVGIDINYGSAMLNLGNAGRFAFSVYSLTSQEVWPTDVGKSMSVRCKSTQDERQAMAGVLMHSLASPAAKLRPSQTTLYYLWIRLSIHEDVNDLTMCTTSCFVNTLCMYILMHVHKRVKICGIITITFTFTCTCTFNARKN